MAASSAEEGPGSAKEAAGKLFSDRDPEQEARADQASAGTKQAGENIKDAAQKLKEGLTK